MNRLADYVTKLASVGGTDLLLGSDRPPQYRSVRGLLPLPGEAAVPGSELQAMLESWLGPERWSQLLSQRALSCVAQLDATTRLRVRCSWAEPGATAQLRLLGSPRTLAELQLPEPLAALAELPSGLVIIAGPRSSGKTSLLAALIRLIAERRVCHIVTLEAPIELLHASSGSSISQREVPTHCASFANGIRSALNSNADVVALASHAEPGSLEQATRAASSALVLVELAGYGAASVLDRLMLSSTTGLGSAGLADTFAAIVALELLPKRGGGRVPVAEIVLRSPAVVTALQAGKAGVIGQLSDAERGAGSPSLDSARQDLMRQGLIEPPTASSRRLA